MRTSGWRGEEGVGARGGATGAKKRFMDSLVPVPTTALDTLDLLRLLEVLMLNHSCGDSAAVDISQVRPSQAK